MDAAQGIEAQTLANVYLALDHDLEIMPVINKIDLPSADPDRVVEEIEDVIGIEAQDAPKISAKNGINIEQVLEQIVKRFLHQVEARRIHYRHSFSIVYMILIKELSFLHVSWKEPLKRYKYADDGNWCESRSC